MVLALIPSRINIVLARMCIEIVSEPALWKTVIDHFVKEETKLMRFTKQISLLILVCAAFFTMTACAKKAPRIAVEPTSQELGEIPQQKIELVYTVRNEGEGNLQIEKIITSCDCTKAVIDKNLIAAGQSAALTVTLDPTDDNLYGDITRVIYLRSNDPTSPEVSVEFHALIQKPE